MTLLDGLELGSQIIGGAAILAAIFPKTSGAVPVLHGLRKVLDLLALNVGNAKNEPAKPAPVDVAPEAFKRPEPRG
jgi:hypothetical protein